MIKSDRWIKQMALEKGMIKPFEDRQVRKGMISYGVSSYGYDLRIADEFKIFTNINNTIVDPKGFDPRSFVDFTGRCLHHPAQLVRAGSLRRVLQDPAQRAHHLRGQVHLRPLRHHHQRDAVRAGVGGLRDARDQQHHAAAREDLRQRGHRPGPASSSRTRRA